MFAYHYLAHEVGDDAVEGGALVAVALLPGAQRAEVLAGLGHHVASQLKSDNITTSDYSHDGGIQNTNSPANSMVIHSYSQSRQTQQETKPEAVTSVTPPSLPRLLLATMNS